MTNIDILVFDGLDELDALGPLEVLRAAARAGADLTVRLVCWEEPLDVRGGHGLWFRADSVYSPGADVLVVPGGGWLARADTGAWGEAERGYWLPLLRAAAASGTVMAGVCTGVMLLARAGLVGERPATTHHGARAALEATGARVVDDRVVDDGNLVTAAGVTSGIDLALHLVERFAGRALAEAEANRLEYRWVGGTEESRPPQAADSPHPGGHRITTEESDRWLRAEFDGEVIAESRRALVLREASLPPVPYFPMEDVRMDLLVRTDHRTHCPFKGEASHWSLRVGDRQAEDIAWAYEEPRPERSDLRGRIAFYADRLDVMEVEAEAERRR